MIVHFETYTDGGEMGVLESVEMARAPMKGETVVLRGEEYGGAREFNSDNATMFEVIDVQTEIVKHEDEPKT